MILVHDINIIISISILILRKITILNKKNTNNIIFVLFIKILVHVLKNVTLL